MNIPLIHLNRRDANEILDAWKKGAQVFPEHVIRLCLYVTGDLQSLR